MQKRILFSIVWIVIIASVITLGIKANKDSKKEPLPSDEAWKSLVIVSQKHEISLDIAKQILYVRSDNWSETLNNLSSEFNIPAKTIASFLFDFDQVRVSGNTDYDLRD